MNPLSFLPAARVEPSRLGWVGVCCQLEWNVQRIAGPSLDQRVEGCLACLLTTTGAMPDWCALTVVPALPRFWQKQVQSVVGDWIPSAKLCR